MRHRWFQSGVASRCVAPCALVALVALGKPASVRAESAARQFGFTTIFGANNRNEEARDVAATDFYENGICAVGQVSADVSTTDSTTVNPGNLGTAGAMDVWLACWNTTGGQLFATVFGGPGYDAGYAVAIDSSGIYVGGRAGPGLAITPSGLQPSFAGDSSPSAIFGPQDGFIAKYSWSGEKLWLSYFGDSSSSYINDLAVDPSGAVYAVLADVTADNPHVTAGAFTTVRPGGGDAVVAKLQNTGQLAWATYLGGSGADLHAPALAVDERSRNVFVVGSGNSTNFPTTATAFQSAYGGGISDLTLTALSASGGALVFSTYFGGNAADSSNGNNIVVDSFEDRVIISGDTTSPNISTIGATHQATLAGGTDMVLAAFTLNGVRTATSYLGGAGTDHNGGLSLNNANLVVTGSTDSDDLPQQYNEWRGQGVDGYVAVTDQRLTRISSANRIGGDEADAFLAVAATSEGYAVVGWSASNELRNDREELPEQSTGANRRDTWIMANKYIADQPINGGADAPLGCDELGNCGGYDPTPTGCVSCASASTGRPAASNLLLFGCTALLLRRARRRRAAHVQS